MCFIDSEWSDKCIGFIMMCVFYFVCVHQYSSQLMCDQHNYDGKHFENNILYSITFVFERAAKTCDV